MCACEWLIHVAPQLPLLPHRVLLQGAMGESVGLRFGAGRSLLRRVSLPQNVILLLHGVGCRVPLLQIWSGPTLSGKGRYLICVNIFLCPLNPWVPACSWSAFGCSCRSCAWIFLSSKESLFFPNHTDTYRPISHIQAVHLASSWASWQFLPILQVQSTVNGCAGRPCNGRYLQQTGRRRPPRSPQ